MSTQGFAFPPPPPPPPQRNHDAARQPTRGDYYGNGPPRGRGGPRGSTVQRGNLTGGRGRGNNDVYRGATNHRSRPPTSRGSPSNPAFKRTHATAFSQSRPQAPPAVPSFSASIENSLSPKPVQKTLAAQPAVPKKTNLLGLTPADAEASDSEDDNDEESRVLDATSPHDLNFEYKGQTSTLRTAAEIAAWIAERRKRWPTEAKREVARKEAEERKHKWEEEKKKRNEAFQAARKKREEERSKAITSKQQRASQPKSLSAPVAGSEPVSVAQSRTERLRRKALKAQKKLEAAEKELLNPGNISRTGSVTRDAHIDEANQYPDEDSSSVLSDSSELTDSTSSSGSDSDEGSAPEETSSKVQVERLETSAQKRPPNRRPCQFFAKHGTCKYGARCRNSHDLKQAPSRNFKAMANGNKPGRKGLWQVMVEKEEEEERKKVLEAIIALGKQGVLDDS